jgi:hypothetical protein
MKLTCLASFLSLIVASAAAQNTSVEQKTVIEDGLVKTWKIEKSYDQNGNLISTDSSYIENPMSESGNGSFEWNSGNGMRFGFSQGPNFNQLDSLRNGFNQDWKHYFDEMIQRYHEQLSNPIPRPYNDSLIPADQFIFPDDKQSLKKI